MSEYGKYHNLNQKSELFSELDARTLREADAERQAQHVVDPDLEHTAEDRRPTEADLIALGILRAEKRETFISHGVARAIAGQLHDGQGSGLYSFASSGAIEKERIGPELAGLFASAPEGVEGDLLKDWSVAFGRYMEHYEDRPPVEDWNQRYNLDTAIYDAADSCARCGSHFSEPHAPDCEHGGERLRDDPIEIYVASLTDYNNGRLHGVWIDATMDIEEVNQAVEFMLRNSYFPEAEEFAIHDTSGFEGVEIGEYTTLADVTALAKGIEEHGDAFVQWVGHYGRTDVADTVQAFEDHYIGTYQSEEAYAEYILSEGDYNRLIEEARNMLPEHLREHMKFDLESYTRMLSCEETFIEGRDGLHVFSA